MGRDTVNLELFFKSMDALGDPIPLQRLQSMMRELTITETEIADYAFFSTKRYMRNRVRRTDDYETLFLCFEAGQRTPIHDHAGSACGVKVLQGEGTETLFERTPDGWLFASGSRKLPAGGVVGSNDMDTHQLSNLQTDGKRLVTLHVYSPPLGSVGNYSLDDNRVVQVRSPVNELVYQSH